ncbi:MAG: TlpA family protein disulfide reductase [Polyangiaceae bacterium]|nr:TlpA family protein disulfide reductase [Polyangiaceae bacterium]
MYCRSFVRRGLLTVAVPAAVCSCGRPPANVPPTRHPGLQCQAVSFSAPNDAGGLVTIPRSGARVTVLEFWATWCAPCAESLRSALTLQEKLETEGIDLVLVGVLEEGESVAGAGATLGEWGVSSPFIIDRGGTIVRQYGLDELPAIVVLDERGAIHWVSPPVPIDPEGLAAVARGALNNRCGGQS